MSDQLGQPEVYVRPFPGPGTGVIVSNGGGVEPRWAPNGRELFYRTGDRMMVVRVSLGPDFYAESPGVLFRGSFSFMTELTRSEMGHGVANYDVSPDGERFIMVQQDPATLPTQIRVVLNWTEELKPLAGADN